MPTFHDCVLLCYLLKLVNIVFLFVSLLPVYFILVNKDYEIMKTVQLSLVGRCELATSQFA